MARRTLRGDHSLIHNPSSDGTPAPHHDHKQIPVSQSHSSSHGPTETPALSRISASSIT